MKEGLLGGFLNSPIHSSSNPLALRGAGTKTYSGEKMNDIHGHIEFEDLGYILGACPMNVGP